MEKDCTKRICKQPTVSGRRHEMCFVTNAVSPPYRSLVRQCFRDFRCKNKSLPNAYYTSGRFMICIGIAQSDLSDTLLCRVALGQSSLMGRWVHSPNLFYKWIVVLCDEVEWPSFRDDDFQMILLFGINPSFRYDNDYLSDMMYDLPFVAVSIGRQQDRNGGEEASEKPCSKAFRDYKKWKWEKRQINSLKLPMGKLCLVALWCAFSNDKCPTFRIWVWPSIRNDTFQNLKSFRKSMIYFSEWRRKFYAMYLFMPLMISFLNDRKNMTFLFKGGDRRFFSCRRRIFLLCKNSLRFLLAKIDTPFHILFAWIKKAKNMKEWCQWEKSQKRWTL